jgi:hypothetical protein
MVHSNTLRVRLQPQLRDAISDAATARGMSASAWVRSAAMTVARLEGVLFPDVRADGKRRYARIEGGAIVDVQYLADAPESACLDYDVVNLTVPPYEQDAVSRAAGFRDAAARCLEGAKVRFSDEPDTVFLVTGQRLIPQ